MPLPAQHTPLLLQVLEEVSALLLSGESADAVFERLSLAAGRLVDSRMNSIQLLDVERGCLVRRAALGLPAGYLSARGEIPLHGPLAGVCGACARTGEVVIVEDAWHDPLTEPMRDLLKLHGLRSAWSVPLIGREERVLGTLATYCTVPQRPTEEQLAVMQMLARHAALAIETARLMEQTRRAADALATAKLRLEAAFEQMEEGCVMLGPDRRLLLSNPAVARILGQPPPQRLCAPGQEASSPLFFHPDSRPLPAGECPLNRALHGEVQHGVEVVVKKPDGARVFLSINARPLWRKDGTLLGALAVFRDITEARRAQLERDALRRLTEQLTTVATPRDVAEAAYRCAVELLAPDCFCMDLYDATTDQLYSLLLMDLDREGHSQEFAQPPGRGCEEVRQVIEGLPLVVNRTSGQECLDLQVIGSGRRSASLLFVPIRREGQTVGLLSVQSYVLNRYAEADLRVLQELADLLGPPLINAHLRQELNERRALEARHERLRALEQMASGVAHNFNNTLTGVLGYADLLAGREGLDPEVKTMVGHIRASALEAAAVVSRLQQFYRTKDARAGAMPVDLPGLVRETVESTRPRWHSLPQRSGTVVDVQLDLPPVPAVLGQPQELRDALTNLLFNAVEAMPAGGTITIRTALVEESVHLAVADTGIGMPPDFVEHCFEPFFLSKVKRGSGLGLATVHGVVARHGGQITVRSELGKGTVFTLVLPALPGSQGAQQPARTAPPAGRSQPLRILVIDDEPAVRGVIQAMLARHGHQVTLAKDGQEGLQALERSTYDLVVTDLGMPGMDGREVARRIKRLAPCLPVILLTGWGQSAGSMEGIPIDAVLQKPIGMRELLATVEGIVKAPSLRDRSVGQRSASTQD